jgi:peptidoglycan/LPS O-acetylase OafA/YrhL
LWIIDKGKGMTVVMNQGNDRMHALDAVRAFALLAGIVLHGTQSFFMPLPALDNSQSVTLGLVFYVIHIFRMSLFYLIAGFFGRMVFHRKGFAEFSRDRAKRIIIPLVGGWLVFGILTIVVVLWGLLLTFGDQLDSINQTLAFPFLHLWFLYYLLLFYIMFMAIRWCFDSVIDVSGHLRKNIDKIIHLSVSSYLAPILFAVPIGLVLYYEPEWMIWFGIPTPDSGFTPKTPATVGYGTAFIIGWLVHRQTALLKYWQQHWRIHLLLAIVLTIAGLMMVGIKPAPAFLTLDTTSLMVIEGPPWIRFAFTACYTVSIWYWCFAIIGAALQFFSNANKVRRYLADSSYWLYLAHLPIVYGLQVLMSDWNWHWSLKFTFIMSVSITVLLVTYHYWVRNTFIGAILNGRKYPGPTMSNQNNQ